MEHVSAERVEGWRPGTALQGGRKIHRKDPGPSGHGGLPGVPPRSRDPHPGGLVSTRGVPSRMFVGVLSIIIIANVLMGFKLNTDIVKDVVKKPIAPVIGMACQFLLCLCLSGWARAFLRSRVVGSALALGLFVAGIPRGGASNFWVVLLDGNVGLSVTMTFISTLAALGVLPMWLFTLGRVLTANKIAIPYRNILISLAVFVLSIIVGVLVKRKLSPVAQAGSKVAGGLADGDIAAATELSKVLTRAVLKHNLLKIIHGNKS